jgi:peptidoglycan/xylan/chitin deacetylase (PgdA/CDA1 family)
MRTAVKLAVLRAAQLLGLFSVARRVYRRKLRILCYHGFEMVDEASFAPKLFINRTTFERRLATLARKCYRVLSLEEAFARLRTGALPDDSVVITIDDGWASVGRVGAPLLRQFGFPATIYVTSYYVVKGSPVFQLLVPYALWKTSRVAVNLDDLPGLDGGTVDLSSREAREQLAQRLIETGESADEPRRVLLWRSLALRLGLDSESIEESRIVSLLTPEEIRCLVRDGFDIQLHTHRHVFPSDLERARKEILENRAVLEPLAGRALEHFCYPDGTWSESRWPWLESAGIRSATTCVGGLNDERTPAFGLRRFLDGENIRQLEFEAELCGFSEALRRLRGSIFGEQAVAQDAYS